MRGPRLIETPVGPDSMTSITIDFNYCTNSFNFATRKSFIKSVLYYKLIGEYSHLFYDWYLQVGFPKFILRDLKSRLMMF